MKCNQVSKKELSKGCNTDFDHYWEHDAHLNAANGYTIIRAIPLEGTVIWDGTTLHNFSDCLVLFWNDFANIDYQSVKASGQFNYRV